MRSTGSKIFSALAVLAAAATLAACGSNSGSSTAGSPTSGSAGTTASGSGAATPSAGTPAGSASAADVAAAKALIAPYIGQPSKFPVDTPLVKSAKGKRIAYMDCGTPICGLFYTLSLPAAQALGMQLTRIKTGLAADTVASAFSTAVEQKYDGVFVPAIAPALWEAGANQLKANKVPIVTTGVTGVDPAKVDVAQVSDTNVNLAAKLLAAYVVAEHAAATDVVLYITPELPFNNVMDKAFNAEVKTLCPTCKSRTAKIPAATLGNSSASLVINDLQAHPATKTAVFAVGEQTGGLQAALKTSGVKIETIANSPDPATLSQIQSGQMAAGLGLDLPVIAWTAMDSLARLSTGEPAAPGAVADQPPMQFLTKADLKGDVSKGWTGYPDFAARFIKLWKPAT